MKKKTRIFIMMGMVAVLLFGIAGCEPTSEETVESVKGIPCDWADGSTFEEIFDLAFWESEWSFDEELDQVVYNGVYSLDGVDFDVTYYFDYEWEDTDDGLYIYAQVDRAELDGEEMDEDTWTGILADALAVYEE